MREIQQELPFATFSNVRDKDKAQKRRKHLLILGRPRRLQIECRISGSDWQNISERLCAELIIFPGDWNLGEPAPAGKVETLEDVISEYSLASQVIKVAIPPRVIETLDRIRTKLAGSATRPEIIRIVTEEFVGAHKHLIGKLAAPEREKRRGRPGRCQYLKVPFPPAVVRAIGHQSVSRMSEDGEVLVAENQLPPYGLCAVFGTTRQGVIVRALDWFMEKSK